ncbi:MAG: hypothetical protein GY862_28320 [Gammaproteobacteria bacterium]|nr:hypothetical protein [Gammaproteobacteria bacterium]
MERCPACRARLKGASLCPRCGADLSQALCSQSEAEEMQAWAIELLGKNDLRGAAWAVKQALSLKRDPLMLVMRDFIVRCQERRAVARLAKGDRAAALWAAEEALYLKPSPMAHLLKNFISHHF